MKHYRFGYIDKTIMMTRVFECDARDANTAFFNFVTTMESKFGNNAPDLIMLLEVYENGVSIDW